MASVLVLGTLLGLSGLFRTDLLPFAVRWRYWTALIAAGVWLGAAIVGQLKARTTGLSWPLRWLLFSTLLTVPMFGIVGVAQSPIGFPVSVSDFVGLFTKVWIVTAAVTGARMLRQGVPNDHRENHETWVLASPPAESVAAAPGSNVEDRIAVPPALSRRLKPGLRQAELWALEAEDHYVRVPTESGDDLVLLRFSDAVREAAGIAGVGVHRSWWVAENGIERIDMRSGSAVIVLRNGREVPVSKRRLHDVRDAGWV